MTDIELSMILTEAVSEALEIDKSKLRKPGDRMPRDIGYTQIGFHRKLYLPDFILDKVEKSYARLKGKFRPTYHYQKMLSTDEMHKLDLDEVVPMANGIENIRDFVVDVITTFIPTERDSDGRVIESKEYIVSSYTLKLPFRNGLCAFIVLGGERPNIITGYVNEKDRADKKAPNNWMFAKDKKDRKVKEAMAETNMKLMKQNRNPRNEQIVNKVVHDVIAEALARKKKRKTIVNDEGKEVPEKCDKCGGKVGVYIQGEPIYKCSKCGKYFGTVPFPDSLK